LTIADWRDSRKCQLRSFLIVNLQSAICNV
jgi:hypothetical protein